MATAAWHSRQPPTADQLYQRIQANLEQKDPVRARRAEQDVEKFLEQFGADKRAGVLASLQEQWELDRLHGQLQKQALLPQDDAAPLLPVEQLYVDALRTRLLSAEQAVVQLQDLVDLFGNPSGRSVLEQRCVALAKRELAELSHSIQQSSASHRRMIQRRLKQADQMQATDSEGARTIRQAIIRVYSNRPWAEDLVQRAKDALDQ